MTKIITLKNVQEIVAKVGFSKFIAEFIPYLKADFASWETFDKNARVAFYQNQGVMELMPICSPDLFSFKYVNGHPNNTAVNKLTVVGTGLLAKTQTGEPELISEMTLLTALRTGATSYLVSSLLARKNSTKFGIIGCGSQSEFQILAHLSGFDVQKVFYFDVDQKAMEKFAKNLSNQKFELIPCKDAKEVCQNADILTSCTAFAGSQEVIHSSWINPGTHINAIGGDSPHKTELEIGVLNLADKIVVEYFEQTKHEGEIQNLKSPELAVYAEIWEIITNQKAGRQNDEEITLFDGVGFALEDFSMLRYIHELSTKLGIFTELDMVPKMSDPKDLYTFLHS